MSDGNIKFHESVGHTLNCLAALEALRWLVEAVEGV